jgi:hypothetical protein
MENQQANKILSNIGKLTSQVREGTVEISPITNDFLISSLPPLQFDIDLFRFFNRYIHSIRVPLPNNQYFENSDHPHNRNFAKLSLTFRFSQKPEKMFSFQR